MCRLHHHRHLQRLQRLRPDQRGENVQIVVIYFNRFFVNPTRQGSNQLRLFSSSLMNMLARQGGVGGVLQGQATRARDNAPMCGQVVRTAELLLLLRPVNLWTNKHHNEGNLTLTGLTKLRTSLT